MKEIYDAHLISYTTASADGAQSQTSSPPVDFAGLPPWKQLAALARRPVPLTGRQALRPWLVLRGDPEQLRRLRTAEMEAWEASGARTEEELTETSLLGLRDRDPLVRGLTRF